MVSSDDGYNQLGSGPDAEDAPGGTLKVPVDALGWHVSARSVGWCSRRAPRGRTWCCRMQAGAWWQCHLLQGLMKDSGPETHSSVIDYAADVEASHLETGAKLCQIQNIGVTFAIHKAVTDIRS